MMQSLLRFVNCKKIPPNLSWEVLFGDPYGNTRGLKLVHWTNFAGCGPPPCSIPRPACIKKALQPKLKDFFV